MDYYLGQVGISPKDFWKYTFKECYLVAEHYHINNNLDWEKFRYVSCMIYNSNITKSNQAKKPHQLFKLPQDNITKASGPKSTKEEYETFLKKIEEKEKKSKAK